MRTFKLVRKVDHSGVSGVGEVAEGVEFDDGQVVICWLSKYHSIGVFDNILCLEKIHGHEGDTRAVFDDVITTPQQDSYYRCPVCGWHTASPVDICPDCKYSVVKSDGLD